MIRTLIFISLAIVAVSGGHEEEHEHHEPQPYNFGYQVKDKHGEQYRQEKSDGHGHVQGSYGYTDEHGIYREVHYIADKSGFRAEVKTNEPGTKTEDPADVKFHSSFKYDEQEYHGHSGEQSNNDEYRKSGDSTFVLKKQGEHGGHE